MCISKTDNKTANFHTLNLNDLKLKSSGLPAAVGLPALHHKNSLSGKEQKSTPDTRVATALVVAFHHN